jgi:hypothetical protein
MWIHRQMGRHRRIHRWTDTYGYTDEYRQMNTGGYTDGQAQADTQTDTYR